MNILLIQDDTPATASLATSIEVTFRASVHRAATFQTAIEFLLDDNELDLIICDDQKESTRLFKYLVSVGSLLPIIVFTKSGAPLKPLFPDLRIIGYANADQPREFVNKAIENALKVGDLTPSLDEADYCRIRTNLLVKANPLKCAVYIRLSKLKFVKIFQPGDTFDLVDLDRFVIKKGIEYLYVHRGEYEALVSQFQSSVAAIAANEATTPEIARELAISTQDAILELSTKLGFTKEIEAVAKENVKLAVKAVGQNPQLSKILMAFVTAKGNYISSHSIVVANVACALASRMDWPSETTFQKLSLAAIFHDIMLRNNTLAAVHDLLELERRQTEFTIEEIHAFKEHPLKAAAIVQKFTEIPADVDTIIVQHHERPDGTGFPKGLTASQISPLSTLFIVAHELVQYVFNRHPNEGFRDFVEQYKSKYNMGNFKKVLAKITVDEPEETPPTKPAP
ncbi:HD domain-containing phosphohydrolase [Bdellovibrionota bacterium FG-2]